MGPRKAKLGGQWLNLGKQLTRDGADPAQLARMTAAQSLILLAAQGRLPKLGEVPLQAESPKPCR
jgi:hypothetical protein